MSIRKLTKKQAIKLATEDYYKTKKHNYVFNVPAHPQMGYSFARRGEIAGKGIREAWDTSELWKPIYMDSPLVAASFDGVKTETRRLAKRQPKKSHEPGYYICDGFHLDKDHFLPAISDDAPYKAGDLLYVRERWGAGYLNRRKHAVYVEFARDYDSHYMFSVFPDLNLFAPKLTHWFPSIHMPKRASRLWLEVTNCYPQFLQDVTGEQCLAEGIMMYPEIYNMCDESGLYNTKDKLYRAMFACLWDEIAGKNKPKWADSPLVWVTEYKQVDYGPFSEPVPVFDGECPDCGFCSDGCWC